MVEPDFSCLMYTFLRQFEGFKMTVLYDYFDESTMENTFSFPLSLSSWFLILPPRISAYLNRNTELWRRSLVWKRTDL